MFPGLKSEKSEQAGSHHGGRLSLEIRNSTKNRKFRGTLKGGKGGARLSQVVLIVYTSNANWESHAGLPDRQTLFDPHGLRYEPSKALGKPCDDVI